MAASIEPIRGKIAQIISSREVALNIGKNRNVQVGMLFDIAVPGNLEIRDPETREVLGSLQPKAKARVRVVSVADKFAVAATYRPESVNPLRLRGDVGFLFGTQTRTETLKTREALNENFSQEGGYVTIGDPVVQVIDAN